jgi:hypothetical protein
MFTSAAMRSTVTASSPDSTDRRRAAALIADLVARFFRSRSPRCASLIGELPLNGLEMLIRLARLDPPTKRSVPRPPR